METVWGFNFKLMNPISSFPQEGNVLVAAGFGTATSLP